MISAEQQPPCERGLPPMARGYPLLGSLPKFLSDPLETLEKAQAEHGDTVSLNMAGHRFVLITHPKDVEHVLVTNHHNYVKGYDKARVLIGNGLILNEGSSWRHQRSLMQPAFHRSRIDTMVGEISQQITRLVTRWEQAAHSGQAVELVSEMSSLTQAVISKTMFGSDIGAAKRIAKAFNETLAQIEVRLVTPTRLSKLRFLANKRFTAATNVIDAEMRNLITSRAQRESQQDLLGMLLQARDAETGQAMSFQQLRDEVITVYLAGYETTAVSLIWTLHLLANHPHHLDLIGTEARTVLGSTPPTAANIAELQHSRMALNEGLRLYPPAWQFTRRCINQDLIGGYRINPGTTIWLCPYLTHRRPDCWESPNDFIPERFNNDPRGDTAGSGYFPFGAGIRKCIGLNFALTEATLALSEIAGRFHMTPALNSIRARPRTTLKPNGPVTIYLNPR